MMRRLSPPIAHHYRSGHHLAYCSDDGNDDACDDGLSGS